MTQQPAESILELPPRGYHGGELPAGWALTITDLEGGQPCDFVCLSQGDITERLSAHATIMRNESLYVTSGSGLYSNQQRELCRIVEDSVGPGGHDLLCGMCSQASTELKFGVRGAPNCTANLTAALAPWGVPAGGLISSFNVFMRLELGDDGAVAIGTPLSQAGDHVVLSALTDCIFAVSNCPSEWGATSRGELSSIGLEVHSGGRDG